MKFTRFKSLGKWTLFTSLKIAGVVMLISSVVIGKQLSVGTFALDASNDTPITGSSFVFGGENTEYYGKNELVEVAVVNTKDKDNRLFGLGLKADIEKSIQMY